MVATKLIVRSRFDMGYGQIQYKFNKNRFRDYYYAGRASVDDRLIVKESELGNISKEIKYLSLICKNLDDQTSEVLKDFTGLRTLILLCEPSSSITHVPRNVFLNLKHLVTLDLHQFNISELPSSIGNLVSLHYLDVSETPIKHLPESIGSLRRLETLKLKGCLELHHLLNNTTKLIFLRHLDLDIVGQLNYMPTGMGSLRSLRTLKAFLIGTEDGCRVQELLYLNELSGSFCISGLENAQEAKLQDKQYLRKVELRWGGCHNDGPKVEDEILESLQPNSSIEELEILFFNGFRLPSWISDSSLQDIVSITLYKCKNCSRLPSLGTLPSLKYLELHQMTGITAIDHVFCRNYKGQGRHAFPKLEKLIFDVMLNLEEWTGVDIGDFRCLQELKVKFCPNLSSQPVLSRLCSLKYMEISECTGLQSLPEDGLPALVEFFIIKDCPRVKEWCANRHSPDWFKIAHIPRVFLDHEEISPQKQLTYYVKM